MKAISTVSARDLEAFKVIVDFVSNLNEFFTGKDPRTHALNLYHRLVSQTTFHDDSMVARHISQFRDFCIDNRRCIVEKRAPLAMNRITFTAKIFIDLDHFIKVGGSECAETIWEYLTVLGKLLDPRFPSSSSSSSQQLVATDEQQQQPQLDLDNLLGGLLGGGGGGGDILGNLVSSIQNNDVDLKGLLSSVTTMLNTVAASSTTNSNDNGLDPALMQGMLGMLSGALEKMDGAAGPKVEET